MSEDINKYIQSSIKEIVLHETRSIGFANPTKVQIIINDSIHALVMEEIAKFKVNINIDRPNDVE